MAVLNRFANSPICVNCGRTLSSYNKTSRCFSTCRPHAQEVSPKEAEALLRDFLPDSDKDPVGYEQDRLKIARMVLAESADYFKVTEDEILGQRTERRYSLPRRAYYYLLHKDLKYNPAEVGKMTGDRSHSNIYCSMEQLEKSIELHIAHFKAIRRKVIEQLRSQQT